MARIFVGCAGWSLRKEVADSFPPTGSHLTRYSERFNAVEINSSFYRPHRHSTYVRWAESTPDGFRFSVKMPKQITHVKRLVDVGEPAAQFASEISGLGEKLGLVLVQLPPSLRFSNAVAEPFFQDIRSNLAAPIACEPRHPSWFDPVVDSLLKEFAISRVAADPSIIPAAAEPGGSELVTYFRWHGSPRIYYSSYDAVALSNLAGQLLAAADRSHAVWSIFDNTAEGEALRNALQLNELLHAAENRSVMKAP